MSQLSIKTPTLGKNEESSVLKEKQSNALHLQKVTPKCLSSAKKSQIVKPVAKKPTVNENKMPGRSTPLGKNTVNAVKVSKPLGTPRSCHSASHQNERLNTPVSRHTRQAFGSSTKENSNKKLPPNKANCSLSTPLNNNNRSYASARAKQSPAISFVQNPLINGVDYSAVMARKAELGYSGPGYVVEYDCEDQDLKSVHVDRGLWKITTGGYTPNKNNPMQSKLGVPQYCTRLDVESSAKKSPGRHMFGMDILLKNPMKNTNGILRNDSKTMRRLNLADSCLSQTLINQTIDCSIDIPKKTLRWADILEERKSPASFIMSPYANLTPHLLLKESKSSDYISAAGNIANDKQPAAKIRRSLSMNDINDIILDVNEEEKERNLNETFELETPSKPELLKPQQQTMCCTEAAEYTLNKIETTAENCTKQLDDELDNSLNDLKIPFTLDNCDESVTDNENQIKNVIKQTDFIEGLQKCARHLKAHIDTLGLHDHKRKLHVDTSDFIKISNLICDMQKSLETYKDKLTFQ